MTDNCSDDSGESLICFLCKKEIAFSKEWRCETCKKCFDEACYFDKCVIYGCVNDEMMQCKECSEETGRRFCSEEDCTCENQEFSDLPKKESNVQKKKKRASELKKAYKNAFGI